MFTRPLWVAFYGQRRDEVLPTLQGVLYANRFKIEHFFRFIKQNFLMNDFQTPEVFHEESWNNIQNIAYLQLYAAKKLTKEKLYPWEKHLLKKADAEDVSPKKVQRDFFRILEPLPRVTPPLILRGKPKGRQEGFRPETRTRKEIIFKKKPKPKKTEKKTVPPLEKWFDRNIESSNNNPPNRKRKKVTPDFEKQRKKTKVGSYYQRPLFPDMEKEKPSGATPLAP